MNFLSVRRKRRVDAEDSAYQREASPEVGKLFHILIGISHSAREIITNLVINLNTYSGYIQGLSFELNS